MSGHLHRLPVPTPFAVGRINCYLLTGDPLTLVDTGPNSGTSLDTLERMLADHGVTIEDLELVVLTHHHMDHEGLLDVIARRSGAQIAAYLELSPWLADYYASSTADDDYAQAVMRIHGVPEELNTVLGEVAAAYRPYGSGGTVTMALRDGDVLTMGGRDFSVHHRPGHSSSDLVFLDAHTGLMLGGDHLLGHISSNALVTRPFGGGEPQHRPKPLLRYIESMRATRAMPLHEVFPGHGENVTDHVDLIDKRLRLHDRRAAKILRMLAAGPLTGHEIALQMWGNVPASQAYLTLSEVLGHVDVLLAQATVTEVQTGALTKFQVT